MNKIITKITLIVLILTTILGICTIANATYTEVETKLNPYVNCTTCGEIVYVEQATGEVTVTCSNGHTFTANVERQLIKRYGTTNGYPNMPQRNSAGLTGLLPQYYTENIGRSVYLNDSRLDLDTREWDAKIDEDIVYCSLLRHYVRYGQYDPNTYLLYPGGFMLGTIEINSVTGERLSQSVSTIRGSFVTTNNNATDLMYRHLRGYSRRNTSSFYKLWYSRTKCHRISYRSRLQ